MKRNYTPVAAAIIAIFSISQPVFAGGGSQSYSSGNSVTGIENIGNSGGDSGATNNGGNGGVASEENASFNNDSIDVAGTSNPQWLAGDPAYGNGGGGGNGRESDGTVYGAISRGGTGGYGTLSANGGNGGDVTKNTATLINSEITSTGSNGGDGASTPAGLYGGAGDGGDGGASVIGGLSSGGAGGYAEATANDASANGGNAGTTSQNIVTLTKGNLS